MTLRIYLKSGQTLTLHGCENATFKRSTVDGRYTEYEIDWKVDRLGERLLSVSLEQIAAVTTEE